MNYETFFEELMERVFDSPVFNEAEAELTLHLKGEIAAPDDRDTDMFIRNTNLKYFHVEDSRLLGDFAEIKIPCRCGEEKNNFLRFDINQLYDLFCKKGWDGVEKQVYESLDYARHIESSASEIISCMDSYEKIRDKLIIRPLNLKNNLAQLENYVYKCIGDIALVLYAVVLDDAENNCLNTVKIPKSVFEKWNIDTDNLMMSTLLNTNVFAMPRLYTNLLEIENTSDSESAFMSADYSPHPLKPETIPLVTTTRKTNGAIAMFYPGVKEKIAEMFDDSFYVAFTSIHEAMIHKKGTIEPSSIRRHVRATNRTFGPEDTLSDNVFFYNRENHSFTLVAE